MPYSKEHKTQSKDRILQSAAELFCRYGFDKVSIGQIMKVARMTHGAFYAHFESKEALFSASLLEAFKRSKVARLAKGPFSIKHLITLVNSYLNLQELQAKPGAEAILFNEIGSERTEIKRLYEETYLRMRKMLEVRITALSKLKELPFSPEDTDTVADKARAILASLVGAVAIAKSIPTEEEQRSILQAAQQHIFTLLGITEEQLDSPFESPTAQWLELPGLPSPTGV